MIIKWIKKLVKLLHRGVSQYYGLDKQLEIEQEVGEDLKRLRTEHTS